jgi:hypothetical protein
LALWLRSFGIDWNCQAQEITQQDKERLPREPFSFMGNVCSWTIAEFRNRAEGRRSYGFLMTACGLKVPLDYLLHKQG